MTRPTNHWPKARELFCKGSHKLILLGLALEQIWQQLLASAGGAKRQGNCAKPADAVEPQRNVIIAQLISALRQDVRF